MRSLLPLLCLLCGEAATLAAETTPYRVERITAAQLPVAANSAYRLFVPERHHATDAQLPLVVYLHGAGAKGDDNTKPIAELLPALLATPEIQERFPCFVLVPQCKDGTLSDGRPNNWVNWVGQKDNPPASWETADEEPSDQLRGASIALEAVLANHPVDPTRIYLTGVSMGGSGTCYWAARDPDRFAAAIAACGLSEVSKAPALAKVPLRLFHGSDDPVAPVERSRQLAKAIQAASGTARLIEFTGAGHSISQRAFTADNHAALTWLFQQKREGKQ